MPTTSNGDGSFVSNDSFANPHEKALHNLNTTTDGTGVERIVSASTAEFIPAPLEASPEEIAAAERRNAMFDEASKKRQAQLSGDVPDADRAVNNPSDGGSQSTTETQAEADDKAAKAEASAAKQDDTTTDKTTDKATDKTGSTK